MSEPVARGRHTETEKLLSVSITSDGGLQAELVKDEDLPTFIGELPQTAVDPTVAGRWRHFKGGEYTFHAVVRTAPDGPLVLYEDGDGRAWLRPLSMVSELVARDGRRGRRFVRIGD